MENNEQRAKDDLIWLAMIPIQEELTKMINEEKERENDNKPRNNEN